MGNIVEKIGAMVARLGTKLANNYGGTASNRYIVLHAPAGSNNERLDPNCAMSLNEFVQVLGVKRGNFGNTSTSQVVTTKANSNGLLIIGDLSTGGYGFYVIANMVPRLISQMYNDDNIKFSVEKDGNSLVITRTSTSSPGYDNLHYAYLEAY